MLDALRALCHFRADLEPPTWLDELDATAPDPRELVLFRNGILDIPTSEFEPPSPLFFAPVALPFDFDPDAPEPRAWLDFLSDLWPGDPDSIATLGEIFGYLLTPDMRQQKAFLVVGPKRAGKGVIGRVLKGLLGENNTAAPTLSSLTSNFGLAPLIGKSAAIIPDARLSGRADQAAIAERILATTGEDLLTVDRKHRDAWTGRLHVRFVFLTNELPRIADSSGALASRFVILNLERSWYGHEDTGLTDRLLADLPGILNWSLAGWRRLKERGHFEQPPSAVEIVRELEDLGSPIAAFLRDRCEVEFGQSVPVKKLFAEWKLWCAEQGRDRPGNIQTFGRDLRSAVPGYKVVAPRDPLSGAQIRHYEGIGLRVLTPETQ